VKRYTCQAHFAAGVPRRVSTPPSHQQSEIAINTTATLALSPPNSSSNYQPSNPQTLVYARDVQPTPPTLPYPSYDYLAPQHRALAKTAPTLTSTSPTRTVNSKHGGPGEFNAHDSGSGAGYKRVGWICWGDVSTIISTKFARESEDEEIGTGMTMIGRKRVDIVVIRANQCFVGSWLRVKSWARRR
jgi:hypothetical protein